MKDRQNLTKSGLVDAAAVAAWMFEQMERTDYLYQEEVVDDIIERFGERFTYENENGNSAIRRDVLVEFRKLTETTVVWDRSERAWRRRENGDGAGRQAD